MHIYDSYNVILVSYTVMFNLYCEGTSYVYVYGYFYVVFWSTYGEFLDPWLNLFRGHDWIFGGSMVPEWSQIEDEPTGESIYSTNRSYHAKN
jgi:hypothetical protein